MDLFRRSLEKFNIKYGKNLRIINTIFNILWILFLKFIKK